MTDNVTVASGLPTGLSAASRQAIETRVQELGRQLLEEARAVQPTAASSEWWLDRAGDWALHDDALKVRLFRLIDCMPMLHDAGAIDRHLREYFDDDTLGRLPTAIRLGLQAARQGLLAPVAAVAVRAATHAQARRFIAGTNAAEVAAAALAERRKLRAFTLDRLGEAVVSDREADAYAADAAELLHALPPVAAEWPPEPLLDEGPEGPLPRVNLSLKLSALDSQFDAIDPAGTMARVSGRLRPLWRLARQRGAHVQIDMEDYATKDLTLAIFKALAEDAEFCDWPDCGVVVQCYLKDAHRDLLDLSAWAQRRGTPVTIRLVKGAYWDAEKIHAAAAGWPVPVWEQKSATDRCYEEATTFLLEQSRFLRPALGSHNLRSLAHGMAVAEHLGRDRRSLEIQMLYGMADPEKAAVAAAGWRVRVYMPYGELVPGMAYLVRRLLENASNDSFLRAGFHDAAAAGQLLAPPPAAAQPATPDLVDSKLADRGFQNEPLTDFATSTARSGFASAIDRCRETLAAGPVAVPVVIDGVAEPTAATFSRQDPSDISRTVAVVAAASADQARRAVAAAAAAFDRWREVGFAGRAGLLRKLAGLLRRDRFELAATQVFEVGKSWREADADVAEAIDFCEYYAEEATRLAAGWRVDVPGEENVNSDRPRGVTVVIAPWNFPLAILTGMTTAALVAGNPVVMKPAEQSSLTAYRLHLLLLEAGVPPAAVALLPGRGEQVGPVLVADPQTAVIAFTGSRAVGLEINRLAAEATARGGRLIKRVICELGGKNAIIVDDDADLDEAVLAVVDSGFGFQGQKCSACSRVIVHEAVSEIFLSRLAAAVESLRLGPADDPGSRIGPLVDEEACNRVRRTIAAGRASARLVAAVDAGELAEQGWFVGPHLFADVDPAGPLGQEEIFGPVVAVLRARHFDEAIDLANGTPYALTAGVFSRSPAHLQQAGDRLEAGNVYLNRGITGAFVRRQPFGGYRLSGGGSKAGGPDYLRQFLIPRTVTENTLRRGFAPATSAG